MLQKKNKENFVLSKEISELERAYWAHQQYYTRKCVESKKYINRIKYNDRKPKRMYNIAKERIRDKGKSDKQRLFQEKGGNVFYEEINQEKLVSYLDFPQVTKGNKEAAKPSVVYGMKTDPYTFAKIQID